MSSIKARSTFNISQHIKVAADSIEELRGCDVYRLFETCPSSRVQAVAEHIKARRPDLAATVDDDLADFLDAVGLPHGDDFSQSSHP